VTEVVVIGAGPYGLSTAAHLRGLRVPFRIFGKPMTLWRDNMPAGMMLKSDGFATSISAPGRGFPLSQFYKETGRQDYSDIGLRIPLKTLIEYGLAFQQRHVGAVEETHVVGLDKIADGFEVTLDTGERFSTRKVVVATGPLAYRYVPEVFEPLLGELVSHSSDNADPSRFKGQQVIVVGAGQSALELTALLREAGARTTVLARRPLFWFNPGQEDKPQSARSILRRMRRPNFGLGPGWRTWFWSEAPYAYHHLPAGMRAANAYTTFGPAGSGWLKHRVDGLVPVKVGAIVEARECAGKIKLAVKGPDGQETLTADHVVAATGYKVDVAKLAFLDQLVSGIQLIGKAPILDRGFQSSVPGLYFTGYSSAPSFGPSMRFIYGTDFAAARVARALARQSSGQTYDAGRRSPQGAMSHVEGS
jgi:FAD-dependent urate hydroxylase